MQCPGRLVEGPDGIRCDRREWCLVAHLKRRDEDAYREAHEGARVRCDARHMVEALQALAGTQRTTWHPVDGAQPKKPCRNAIPWPILRSLRSPVPGVEPST